LDTLVFDERCADCQTGWVSGFQRLSKVWATYLMIAPRVMREKRTVWVILVALALRDTMVVVVV
jgi:hypothetical protein